MLEHNRFKAEICNLRPDDRMLNKRPLFVEEIGLLALRIVAEAAPRQELGNVIPRSRDRNRMRPQTA